MMKSLKAAGREKEGQQAHPATAGASKRHRCRASLFADGDLRAGPAAHAAPPSTPRSRIGRPAASFLEGCLKEQPHRSFPGQCTDRTGATGVEVLPGRERLVLGAARYNTGKGSSCKIYLTVLPQTPVRGARLDRGPPSHQRSISLCDERVGGGEGPEREEAGKDGP